MVRPLINRRSRYGGGTSGSGNDSDTVLLLHCNGDEGDTGHTVTINGTPVLTAEHPIVQTERADPNSTFGNSAYFNGTDAYYTVPDSADWDFAGGNFTVEFWAYFNAAGVDDGIVGATSLGDAGWTITITTNSEVKMVGGTNGSDITTATGVTETNVWTHWAVVRNGNSAQWYKNGAATGSSVDVTGDTYNDTGNGLSVGRYYTNYDEFYYNGYLSEIRISDTARYTTGFTPDQTPFTDDSDTVLLLALSDLDQGDTSAPTDTSTGGAGSPHTVTNVSSKVVGCSWWWSGSMQFDGSTDYLTIPDSTDWDFGSGDFTIEMWAKISSFANTPNIFSLATDGNNRMLWQINASNHVFYVFDTGAAAVTLRPSKGFSTDTWTHLALVRYGNEWDIYENGVSVGSVTDSSAVPAFSSPLLRIGANFAVTGHVTGNLAEYIISDTARYTTTFTPETKPHVADANTLLYLPLNGNQALGRSEAHDITIANTGLIYAQEAENAAYKTSFQFDGSSDYLTIPDSTGGDWDLTTNWTVDLWIKMSDHVGTETLICNYEDAGNNWELKHIHGTGIQFDVDSASSTVVTLAGGEIADTNWTHIALCKVANLYGIYKNGTQVAYVSDADTDTFAGLIYIGAFGGPANYFDGYIDEPRIIQSNIFSASPVVGLTDTISVPSSPYDIAT